jgi:hypothetical protein
VTVTSGWEHTWAGPPDRLPTRSSTVRGLVALLALYLTVGALTAVEAHSATVPVLLIPIVLVAVPVAVLALQQVVLGARVASRVRAIRAVDGGRFDLPEPAAGLVARRLGPVRTKVLIEPVRVHSRCLRHGDHAWIVIAEYAAVDEPSRRFVAAHELGHLLRNDALRGRVLPALGLGLTDAAVVSSSAPAVVIAAAGALLLWVGGRWSAELACDALAARWTGRSSADAWFDRHAALVRQPQNSTPRRRLRRAARTWLTHPPYRLRRAWVARASAPRDDRTSARRAADPGDARAEGEQAHGQDRQR